MPDPDKKKKKRLSRGKIATNRMRTTGAGALATKSGGPDYTKQIIEQIKKGYAAITTPAAKQAARKMRKRIDTTKPTSKF